MNADARRWTKPWTGWPGRRVLGGLALLAIAVVGGHGIARSAEAASGGQYVLFVEVQPPHDRSRARLQKMLKAEGYESFPEGGRELVLVLTESQVAELFQARIRYREAEGSAAAGMRPVPYLEGVRIPVRFGKLMRRVQFDPQR